MKIGIDAGGTLIKIALEQHAEIEYVKFPTAEWKTCAAWLAERYPDGDVCVAGGKSALLASTLTPMMRRPIRQMVEFDATCSGVKFLLNGRIPADSPFLLTNVGTGTSIHCIAPEGHTRIGGTGVGGGTIIGLSWLLAGMNRYSDIVEAAKRGVRDTIDLKVHHIYEGSEPPIPGDLTASNFGYIGQQHPQPSAPIAKEDMLASVIGLVGETVSSISVHAAGRCGASSIVYIGSSFIDNDLLVRVIEDYTKLRGSEAVFLPGGEYSGALGALKSL